ncbi:MAG: hypothetical protein EKK40_13055 [Bradyrhizobiaceae bacterium]|nr:MAG: hypothetical protein EKK40_13055 [Bradyrhizobiaceae bacterium]
MPEPQHKTFLGRVTRRTGIAMLTILPYLLVTMAGAFAVAAVAKTSTGTINAKFNAVIQALKRR